MWLWAMGGEEVRVLTFAVRRAEGDTEPTVTVERLDARTGTLRSTTDTPLDDAGSSFEMNVLERGTDSLVVNLEGRLKVLDTRTGRVTDEWP
jgi:hypothetical protein